MDVLKNIYLLQTCPINVNHRNIDVEKSELVTAQLLPNTASFLILPQGFNCGIFLACGYIQLTPDFWGVFF